jgi:DNA-binding SARP family transcriptional activator
MLWLALVLLVPKRSWRTLVVRLRATADGERRHPFGPPLTPPGDVSSRFLRLLASEAPRWLDLGVPLWLATLRAEHRGSQRRRLAEARWTNSPAGWTWSHLRGRIDEEELLSRLRSEGYPLPAAKARLRFRGRHATFPMSSRLQQPDDSRLEPGSIVPMADGQRDGEPARLRSRAPLFVQALGTLKVRADDTDLTAELLAGPTVSFLWQYLLLRAIHEPGHPVPRTVVADELYPGVEHERQLERLRKRLHHMQTNLPLLSRSLKVTDRDLMLDLETCRIDAIEILCLPDDNRGTGLLPGSVVAQIESAIAATATEFLPDWEDLQQTVNRGRGAGEEYVRSARFRLQEARVALLVRLGSHFLAHREAGRAAATLDEAFRLDPARQGLAEELAKALDAAGHRARARDIRKRYVQRE